MARSLWWRISLHPGRKVLSYAVIGSAISLGFILWSSEVHAQTDVPSSCDAAKSSWCVAPRLEPELDTIAGATVPKLATPAWMSPVSPEAPRVVTYNISARGTIVSNSDEFRTTVADTLHDVRGWAHLGVTFTEVDSGGDFTIYLSTSSQMTTFASPQCTAASDCTVGKAVVINDTHWQTPDTAWIKAGADQTSYRQMLINHEIGHWLGLGNRSCPAAGELAPIMLQQANGLQGCKPNAWPLSSELYAPTLGIRS